MSNEAYLDRLDEVLLKFYNKILYILKFVGGGGSIILSEMIKLLSEMIKSSPGLQEKIEDFIFCSTQTMSDVVQIKI